MDEPLVPVDGLADELEGHGAEVGSVGVVL
jgi:hypothetical protein